MEHEPTVSVADLTHPYYKFRAPYWEKWRLTFEGGDVFINRYLQRFSKSEDLADFDIRKRMTYNPAFAKVAVIEVRNSIYQRLADITRSGGSKSWQDAIAGLKGGVDLLGSSMSTFMGTEILEELLVMGKVGIYVDMPPKNGPTQAENLGKRPYLYMYKVEDIRCWDDDESPTPHTFRAVLLRDYVFQKDAIFGLPMDTVVRYRFYWRNEKGEIWVQFYNSNGQEVGPDGDPEHPDAIKLTIKHIPFVVLELNNSLMADIANYQIALLNLASMDMGYCGGAAFPFYTEQYDPKSDPAYMKSRTTTIDETTGGVTVSNDVGSTVDIPVGPSRGRRYPKGVDPPSFIHPSPEPIKASMDKQEQLKLDIRLLINLSIANIQPKMASAESKGMDTRTLESGLSYIGLNMEDGERQVCTIWHEYEGASTLDVVIKYPEKYSLRNDKDVYAEIDELKKQMSAVNSLSYKRSIAKRIVDLLLGSRLSMVDLNKIYAEIDKAEPVEVFVEKIEKDVALGFLDPELAAKLRGYPPETVKKAQDAQVERLKRIAISQQKGKGAGAAVNGDDSDPDGLKNPGARGVSDLSPNPTQDTQKEKDAAGNPVRGASNKERVM